LSNWDSHYCWAGSIHVAHTEAEYIEKKPVARGSGFILLDCAEIDVLKPLLQADSSVFPDDIDLIKCFG